MPAAVVCDVVMQDPGGQVTSQGLVKNKSAVFLAVKRGCQPRTLMLQNTVLVKVQRTRL